MLNFLFLTFLTAVVVLSHTVIEGAPVLILVYSSLFLCQAVLILVHGRGKFFRLFYDIIFPTISILVVFDSLGRIVHSINPRDIDPLLIRLDYLLFHGYPTVMMEKVMHPLLTDILQLSYASYYFMPVALGVMLKMRGDDGAFDRSLFLIMLCFYLSYVGYMLWPAIGPRFTLNHLQGTDIRGLLVAGPIQELLNRLEGVKRDAFPSGHTGIALTVLYLAHRFERGLYRVLLPAVGALIFATVYCRYHYVVDVIGGVALAAITILAGEACYGYREKRLGTDRR